MRDETTQGAARSNDGLGVTDLVEIHVRSFELHKPCSTNCKVWRITFDKGGETIVKFLYVDGVAFKLLAHGRLSELKYQLLKLCLEVERDFYFKEHACDVSQVVDRVKAPDAWPLFAQAAKLMPNMAGGWYL